MGKTCEVCEVQPGYLVRVGLGEEWFEKFLCSWDAQNLALSVPAADVRVGAFGSERPPGVGDLPAVVPELGVRLPTVATP